MAGHTDVEFNELTGILAQHGTYQLKPNILRWTMSQPNHSALSIWFQEVDTWQADGKSTSTKHASDWIEMFLKEVHLITDF